MEFDYIIVGAGFSGACLRERFLTRAEAVMAERLANEKKASVLIIEKKRHFGGLSSK